MLDKYFSTCFRNKKALTAAIDNASSIINIDGDSFEDYLTVLVIKINSIV